jgi:hypothetical protein
VRDIKKRDEKGKIKIERYIYIYKQDEKGTRKKEREGGDL